MAIDLDPRESEILAGVLEDAASEIRMEISYTVRMDARAELLAREGLLRRVVGQLRAARDSPPESRIRVSAAKTSPTR